MTSIGSPTWHLPLALPEPAYSSPPTTNRYVTSWWAMSSYHSRYDVTVARTWRLWLSSRRRTTRARAARRNIAAGIANTVTSTNVCMRPSSRVGRSDQYRDAPNSSEVKPKLWPTSSVRPQTRRSSPPQPDRATHRRPDPPPGLATPQNASTSHEDSIPRPPSEPPAGQRPPVRLAARRARARPAAARQLQPSWR